MGRVTYWKAKTTIYKGFLYIKTKYRIIPQET